MLTARPQAEGRVMRVVVYNYGIVKSKSPDWKLFRRLQWNCFGSGFSERVRKEVRP
jgi:hypothetical protein